LGREEVVILNGNGKQAAALVDPEFAVYVPTGQGVGEVAPMVAT
jgi:hypothetical protein